MVTASTMTSAPPASAPSAGGRNHGCAAQLQEMAGELAAEQAGGADEQGVAAFAHHGLSGQK
jgi:hypothetical protein